MKKIIVILLVICSMGLTKHAKSQGSSDSQIKRNAISFAVSDVVLKRLSFQYERILNNDGKISIVIPFSYAFDDMVTLNSGYGYNDILSAIQDYSHWYVGLGSNFYPFGHRIYGFYFGPEIRLGPAKRNINCAHIQIIEGDEVVENAQTVEYIQSSFLMNVGLSYQPENNIVVGLNIGFGGMSSYEGQSIQEQFIPTFRFGLKF